ncbi:MAG: transglutaminase family protein [Candidatus Heimdallarchaeota archaeon]
MRLRYSQTLRFSGTDLRNVSVRTPLAAEHYAKGLACHSDHPMKIFTKKGNIFGQISFSSLPARVVHWEVEISVRTIKEADPGRHWGNMEEYSPVDIQRYCQSEAFWEVGADAIQKTAHRISLGSDGNIYDLVRKTFAFVQQSIVVPEAQKDRFGALRTLARGLGDCDEFSDLFITILRALRIPARRITGVFVKGHQAEPHAWAEILLPRSSSRWLTMDPALGFFGRRSQYHFGRKIESTISTRSDIAVQWKGKKSARVQISVIPPDLLEA